MHVLNDKYKSYEYIVSVWQYAKFWDQEVVHIFEILGTAAVKLLIL